MGLMAVTKLEGGFVWPLGASHRGEGWGGSVHGGSGGWLELVYWAGEGGWWGRRMWGKCPEIGGGVCHRGWGIGAGGGGMDVSVEEVPPEGLGLGWSAFIQWAVGGRRKVEK